MGEWGNGGGEKGTQNFMECLVKFKELLCQQKEEFPLFFFFYSARHSVWTDLSHEEEAG